MAIVIGTLRIDLEANTATFAQALDKASHLSAKTSTDIKRSLEKIAAAGIAMGAAIIGATAGLVLHSHHAIISLGNTAEAVGTTVEALSTLQYASLRTNVSFETITGGMAKLAKAAYGAQNGNAALSDIFSRLGVHVTDSNGRLKDTGQLLNEVAPGFARMHDGAGKTAMAMALFGKSGAGMIPFLNEWAEKQNELTANSKKFGMTLTADVIDKAQAFDDTIDDLQAATKGFGYQLTAAAYPALKAFGDKLVEIAIKADIPKLAAGFGGNLASALKVAGDLLDFMVQHATALKLVLEGIAALKFANFAIPIIGQLAKGGLGNVGEGIEKFTVGLLGVKNVLPVLGGIAGWFRAAIPLMFEAGGASYVFSTALAAIGGPITVAIIAIGALAAAMYAYRDSTFEAYNATYTWGDAFRAAFFMEGFVGNEEGLKRAKARRTSTGFMGPIDDRPKKPKELAFPDTAGIGDKKDPFLIERGKLDLEIATTAKYISVIGQAPEKILAVVAAEKALAIIRELNQKHADKREKSESAAHVAEIKTKTLEEETLKAIKAYTEGISEQTLAAGLAVVQSRNMAAANLAGESAVRDATIENELLAASFRKIGAGTPEATTKIKALGDALRAKASMDLIAGTNKEIYSLQQEAAIRKITSAAAMQNNDVMREAQIQAKLYAIDQEIANTKDLAALPILREKRALTEANMRAELAEADAKEAKSLMGPFVEYDEELKHISALGKALELNQGRKLNDAEATQMGIRAQDAFNKLTDQSVSLLLRENTAGAGVKAFFLDMQKESQKTAAIVYQALHSAFDKISDQLTELVTGGKTEFAKMFQDIGKQMVNASIKKGLQTALGKIGEKFGIGLPKPGPDGTIQNPYHVIVAGGLQVPGLKPPSDQTAEQNSASRLAGLLNSMSKGPGKLSTIFSTIGGMIGGLGGLFGGGGGGGGESVTSSISFGGEMAMGGRVSPGSAYLVGERGPEILMGASGYIASNSASQRMLGAGGSNHYYSIDARGTDPVLTEQRTRAAIIAAHSSAIDNSFKVQSEHLKRTPQR